MVPPDAGCDWAARRFGTTTPEQQREPVALLGCQRRRRVDDALDALGELRAGVLPAQLDGLVRLVWVETASAFGAGNFSALRC